MPIQNAKESNPVFEYLKSNIDKPANYQDIMEATNLSLVKLYFYLYLIMFGENSYKLHFLSMNSLKMTKIEPIGKINTVRKN